MTRIILDPSRDGCTIWFPDRDTVKFIHGNPMEICERIHKFATYIDFKTRELKQGVIISVDAKGMGMAYADGLSLLNLRFYKIQSEKYYQI